MCDSAVGCCWASMSEEMAAFAWEVAVLGVWEFRMLPAPPRPVNAIVFGGCDVDGSEKVLG